MTDVRLPWPTPDSRAQLWAPQFEDMHEILKDLAVPEGLQQEAESVLTTAIELIRFSFYRHEFSAVGAAVSLIAIEAALRDRYGRGRLVDYIQRARDDGLLTAEEADLLDTAGRPIRNQFAHGELTHVTLTMPMAVNIVATSIRLLTVLHVPSQP